MAANTVRTFAGASSSPTPPAAGSTCHQRRPRQHMQTKLQQGTACRDTHIRWRQHGNKAHTSCLQCTHPPHHHRTRPCICCFANPQPPTPSAHKRTCAPHPRPPTTTPPGAVRHACVTRCKHSPRKKWGRAAGTKPLAGQTGLMTAQHRPPRRRLHWRIAPWRQRHRRRQGGYQRKGAQHVLRALTQLSLG